MDFWTRAAKETRPVGSSQIVALLLVQTDQEASRSLNKVVVRGPGSLFLPLERKPRMESLLPSPRGLLLAGPQGGTFSRTDLSFSSPVPPGPCFAPLPRACTPHARHCHLHSVYYTHAQTTWSMHHFSAPTSLWKRLSFKFFYLYFFLPLL